MLLMTAQAGPAGSLISATRTALGLNTIALVAKLDLFAFNRLKPCALMSLVTFPGNVFKNNGPDYQPKRDSEYHRHDDVKSDHYRV